MGMSMWRWRRRSDEVLSAVALFCSVRDANIWGAKSRNEKGKSVRVYDPFGTNDDELSVWECMEYGSTQLTPLRGGA